MLKLLNLNYLIKLKKSINPNEIETLEIKLFNHLAVILAKELMKMN